MDARTGRFVPEKLETIHECDCPYCPESTPSTV